MSYQALARKWRPKEFAQVVGQEHVVEALSNALDADRIHHAFLFTGTRGVGKTTLARIFAKALNCEKGVSSTPCQECPSCQAVDEGRFIDLIEVDAASRTKVEDTRELLDNVQYAPTSGRYKVYLIDEVHMLSAHSFNALLKTLEEPPDHVKFLLATTDPQKLPVTVLSRCLQFNLKALRPEQISGQLIRILTSDGVEYDDVAIDMIARAADGSVRDSLSLLDQAVAQGGGEVREESVRKMLGTIRSEHSAALIEGLLGGDADRIMQTVRDMSEDAVDFITAIDEVLLQLYYLSLSQTLPAALEQKPVDHVGLGRLAEKISPEDIQLYYQIGLIGKRDITLAPDVRTGFEMIMLRMLSFVPSEAGQADTGAPETAPREAPPVAAAQEADSSRPEVPEETQRDVEPDATPPEAPIPQETPPGQDDAASGGGPAAEHNVSGAGARSKVDWGKIISLLNLTGLINELAMHCTLSDYDANSARLLLDPEHEQLLSDSRRAAIEKSLSEHFGREIRLTIVLEKGEAETPAEARSRLAQEKHDETREALYQEEGVQELMKEFGATVNESSIQSK